MHVYLRNIDSSRSTYLGYIERKVLIRITINWITQFIYYHTVFMKCWIMQALLWLSMCSLTVAHYSYLKSIWTKITRSALQMFCGGAVIFIQKLICRTTTAKQLRIHVLLDWSHSFRSSYLFSHFIRKTIFIDVLSINWVNAVASTNVM